VSARRCGEVGDFKQEVAIAELARFGREIGGIEHDHDVEVGGGGEGGVIREPVDGAVKEGAGKAGEAAGFVDDPLAGDGLGVGDDHG
jgi:hypothetical protein